MSKVLTKKSVLGIPQFYFFNLVTGFPYRKTVLRFSTLTEKKTVLKTKVVSSESLAAKYNSKEVESIWYDWWEKQNYFKPTKSDRDSFVILLPPPNITGTLHLGHVLAVTLQDVILRWRRMKGESVLWVPGLDHAGIATQVAVEKYLEQTLGSTRHDLGREEFIKRVWEWKEDKGSKICEQLRSLGASLDWSRLKFTMDPVHSQTVANAFIKLFNDGLIYRNRALVNWSCTLRSSISDIEINWLEINKETAVDVPGYEKPVKFGSMYAISYKVCDDDNEITVHTTRPETMLGDVAIAVHPDDPNYFKYRNKMVWHPFRQEKIPIIVDNLANPNMGSGAVKITPSHSLEDYKVGQRHNLPMIDVINEEGFINNVGVCTKFFGLKRYEAREVIIDELQNLGLFKGTYEHSLKLPICSRSNDVVEQLPKNQWFLKCDSLEEDAINLVNNDELKLQPQNYKNVWMTWLKSDRDWNLSRQLWWGHRVPMYECTSGEKSAWVAALNLDEAILKGSAILKTPKESISVTQDTDVLDTWFSSALLPLNTLSEPVANLGEKPPISLMITGHDILFFWVTRMVMLTRYLTGKLPFDKILLHSLVFDSKGKKMSKSLGNAIKPEDIINGKSLDSLIEELRNSFKQGLIADKNLEGVIQVQKKTFPKGIPECGADALRFSLCLGNVFEASTNFDVQICVSVNRFCNKIWQATKYLIKIVNDYKALDEQNSRGFHFKNVQLENENLNSFDRWILSRLAQTVDVVDNGLNDYKFPVATLSVKNFFTEEFCSVYLESTKACLKHNLIEYKKTVLVLYNCIETSLKLLSPFMPFVTEHLYHGLPEFEGIHKSDSVTISEFPNPKTWRKFRDTELDQKFKKILNLFSALNRTRILYQLTTRHESDVFVKCSDDVTDILFGDLTQSLATMANVKSFTKVNAHEGLNVIENVVADDFVIYVSHNHDRETLLKHLGPTIEQEKSVRTNLEKLKKTMSGQEWEKMPPLEKTRCDRKLINLENKLKDIEEFKKTIAWCTS